MLLLACGDSGRSAVVARFRCDLIGEDSMLVTDEESLEYGEMTPRASSWSAAYQFVRRTSKKADLPQLR